MNQKQFAAHVGANQATVSRWKERGWLVFAEPGVIDVEATKARLIEERGQTGPMSKRQARMASGWSKSPHCETHRAFACQRAFKA
jgi:hypothetical protein